MRIDHIPLRSEGLERRKQFCANRFGARAGDGYVNPGKRFSYCPPSLDDGAAR